MGRGRAKAKQTKVARRLKYTTTGTDLDRLRAELSSGSPVDEDDATGDEVEDGFDDPYADYLDDEDALDEVADDHEFGDDSDGGSAASARGSR